MTQESDAVPSQALESIAETDANWHSQTGKLGDMANKRRHAYDSEFQKDLPYYEKKFLGRGLSIAERKSLHNLNDVVADTLIEVSTGAGVRSSSMQASHKGTQKKAIKQQKPTTKTPEEKAAEAAWKVMERKLNARGQLQAKSVKASVEAEAAKHDYAVAAARAKKAAKKEKAVKQAVKAQSQAAIVEDKEDTAKTKEKDAKAQETAYKKDSKAKKVAASKAAAERKVKVEAATQQATTQEEVSQKRAAVVDRPQSVPRVVIESSLRSEQQAEKEVAKANRAFTAQQHVVARLAAAAHADRVNPQDDLANRQDKLQSPWHDLLRKFEEEAAAEENAVPKEPTDERAAKQHGDMQAADEGVNKARAAFKKQESLVKALEKAQTAKQHQAAQGQKALRQKISKVTSSSPSPSSPSVAAKKEEVKKQELKKKKLLAEKQKRNANKAAQVKKTKEEEKKQQHDKAVAAAASKKKQTEKKFGQAQKQGQLKEQHNQAEKKEEKRQHKKDMQAKKQEKTHAKKQATLARVALLKKEYEDATKTKQKAVAAAEYKKEQAEKNVYHKAVAAAEYKKAEVYHKAVAAAEYKKKQTEKKVYHKQKEDHAEANKKETFENKELRDTVLHLSHKLAAVVQALTAETRLARANEASIARDRDSEVHQKTVPAIAVAHTQKIKELTAKVAAHKDALKKAKARNQQVQELKGKVAAKNATITQHQDSERKQKEVLEQDRKRAIAKLHEMQRLAAEVEDGKRFKAEAVAENATDTKKIADLTSKVKALENTVEKEKKLVSKSKVKALQVTVEKGHEKTEELEAKVTKSKRWKANVLEDIQETLEVHAKMTAKIRKQTLSLAASQKLNEELSAKVQQAQQQRTGILMDKVNHDKRVDDLKKEVKRAKASLSYWQGVAAELKKKLQGSVSTEKATVVRAVQNARLKIIEKIAAIKKKAELAAAKHKEAMAKASITGKAATAAAVQFHSASIAEKHTKAAMKEKLVKNREAKQSDAEDLSKALVDHTNKQKQLLKQHVKQLRQLKEVLTKYNYKQVPPVPEKFHVQLKAAVKGTIHTAKNARSSAIQKLHKIEQLEAMQKHSYLTKAHAAVKPIVTKQPPAKTRQYWASQAVQAAARLKEIKAKESAQAAEHTQPVPAKTATASASAALKESMAKSMQRQNLIKGLRHKQNLIKKDANTIHVDAVHTAAQTDRQVATLKEGMAKSTKKQAVLQSLMKQYQQRKQHQKAFIAAVPAQTVAAHAAAEDARSKMAAAAKAAQELAKRDALLKELQKEEDSNDKDDDMDADIDAFDPDAQATETDPDALATEPQYDIDSMSPNMPSEAQDDRDVQDMVDPADLSTQAPLQAHARFEQSVAHSKQSQAQKIHSVLGNGAAGDLSELATDSWKDSDEILDENTLLHDLKK